MVLGFLEGGCKGWQRQRLSEGCMCEVGGGVCRPVLVPLPLLSACFWLITPSASRLFPGRQ